MVFLRSFDSSTQIFFHLTRSYSILRVGIACLRFPPPTHKVRWFSRNFSRNFSPLFFSSHLFCSYLYTMYGLISCAILGAQQSSWHRCILHAVSLIIFERLFTVHYLARMRSSHTTLRTIRASVYLVRYSVIFVRQKAQYMYRSSI